MTDEERLRTAIDLVHAMMGSASSEKIRRIEWWSRAKSALETAAMSADSYGSMVSVMGRKLQINVTTLHTGEQIGMVAAAVGADFEAFRRFCASDALYVVAIAQAESKARREEHAARRADDGSDDGTIDKYIV